MKNNFSHHTTDNVVIIAVILAAVGIYNQQNNNNNNKLRINFINNEFSIYSIKTFRFVNLIKKRAVYRVNEFYSFTNQFNYFLNNNYFKVSCNNMNHNKTDACTSTATVITSDEDNNKDNNTKCDNLMDVASRPASKCLCQNVINLNLNNFFINFYKNDKIIKLLANNNNNNNNSCNINKNVNSDDNIDFNSDNIIFKKNFSGIIKIFIIRKNSNPSCSNSSDNNDDEGGSSRNNTSGKSTLIDCDALENCCVNTIDSTSVECSVQPSVPTADNGTPPTTTTTATPPNVCTREVSDFEFKQILCELKRKIEQTERMNWLCLSKRPMVPPNRKTSLPKHSEVKKRFLEICDRTLSDEVKSALRLPAFDSYEWEDADVLNLMQTMFMELGLLDKFNIPVATLREWLYEVYKHYNEVPFHNFRHCFCVAQMMYAMTWRVDLINRLGALEVLILLVSCICHDLDHPGYNNIYQINARTELALRYNDISPLENHHCSIAFRLLEHPDCNIFKTFSKESFKEIREGIIRCILATDMARHNEILDQFKEITPVFDYTSKAHTNLLCMVLIKVADISNEARPMDVAEPWLDRLLQEFFAQSALEKSEGLPVTPFMDPDKVSKPGSQVRFIGLVLLPLFEALGELLTELQEFIIMPVRVALDYYRRLNDAQTKSRRSMAETEGSSESGSPQLPRSQSGMSMRSRRSIPSQKSTSRNSVDDQGNQPIELQDLPEGSESGDSETQTEVDVAEKTSKFKVDTEGMGRSKNYQPGSRKGSREKRPSMCGDYYISTSGRMGRGSHGNIHSYHSNRCNFGANRAVSLDQYGTSNRRMSEGLPVVTSDTQVFYNHFQHHHNHHLNHGHNHPSQFQSHFRANSSETDATTNSSADAKLCEEDCENMNVNASNLNTADKSQLINTTVVNNSNLPPISGGANNNQTNKLQNSSRDGATKSFISRLRQLTGRLSFSFDKETRRNGNAQAKNNNAEIKKSGGGVGGGGGGGHCCNISPLPKAKHQLNDVIGNNSTRDRAYSLDVPINRNRFSCSSGDGSRKSSSSTTTKNEEYAHPKCGINITIDHDDSSYSTKDLDGNENGGGGGGPISSCNI